jgi:hypothetical protein
VFTGASVIAPLPDALTPEVISALAVEVQLKVAPTIEVLAVKFSEALLQISVWSCVAVLVICGDGSTVTVTSVVDPLHPFADGVILYVTVPLVTPSVEVSTWLIRFPVPAAAPLTLDDESTVQLKVVPLTLFGLVIAIAGDVPEQIVVLLAATVGIGRTVTT